MLLILFLAFGLLMGFGWIGEIERWDILWQCEPFGGNFDRQ